MGIKWTIKSEGLLNPGRLTRGIKFEGILNSTDIRRCIKSDGLLNQRDSRNCRAFRNLADLDFKHEGVFEIRAVLKFGYRVSGGILNLPAS